jgi:hypothetical protein
MPYSAAVQEMTVVAKGANYGATLGFQEGRWGRAKVTGEAFVFNKS